MTCPRGDVSLSSSCHLDALGLRRSKSQENTCTLSYEATMTSEIVYGPNQKDVLIGLNGRLAAYLEKVKSLEEANRQLEQQIQQATEKRVVGRDYSRHQKTIAELESQINRMKLSNPELYLKIENTRLAADGFRAKYDAELATRRTIEADIKKLKATSGDLDMQRRCLEVEVQILSNELENLRKTHTEEREHLLQQKLGCEVNVEVNKSVATQLPGDLDKLRQQYKELADHHKKVSDAWFDRKTWESTHLNIQTNLDSESLVNQKRQLSMLRKTVKELKLSLKFFKT
ncbi:keratin, type I cytoskeletal 18-like, partial [Hyla sarda]|uniref:keratin, type I cytoskeletal 18-like n=1 Tax=Hyla sarda TaxID=327740 RepID=UPI0024C3C9E1